MTRRFEFEEGGSSKFWEVSVDGADMTVTYGRIGTNGQAKTKSFASPAAAQKEADKLIVEKTKKGYAEVGATAATKAAATPAAATPAAATPAAATPAAATPAATSAATSPAPTHAPSIAAVGPSVVIDGDTVYFDPPAWALDEREPSVDTPMRPRKAGSFEDTWKTAFDTIQRHLTSGHWKWADDASLSDDDRALLAKAKERLASRNEGADFDESLEAYTFALGRSAPIYPAESVPLVSRALARWTQRTTPATALTTLLRAERIRVFTTDNYRTLRVVRVDEGADGVEMGWGRDVPEALREHLRQYGRKDLEPILRQHSQRQDILAWILDDEDLADQALAAGRAHTPPRLPLMVAGLMRSAADASELLPHATPATALHAIARHGLAVAETVLKYPGNTRDQAIQWACYPSLLAARRLVPLLENKQNRKLIGDALAHMPAQALVALSEAKGKKTKYKEAIDALLATLSAARHAETESDAPIADEAPLSALPPVFSNPPWRAKKRPKDITFPGLTAQPVEAVLDLSSIDPKSLARDRQRLPPDASPQPLLDAIAAGRHSSVWNVIGMRLEHLETLRAAGALTKIDASFWVHDSYTAGLTTLLDVHGLPVLPVLLALAPALKPALCAELEYVGAIEIATLATGWLTKKAARRSATAWVKRFPRHAAAGLLPIALGAESKAADRERAITLLSYLRDERTIVLEEAARLGAEVSTAATALLDRDPLENAPAKAPKLLDGLEHLPRVTLRDGRALSADAQTLLLEMVAFSPIDLPYLGLTQAKEACDPRSLDRFVEALVRVFVASGMAPAHEWAVRAVALVGSDRAARFLFDRARGWAQDGQKQRAMMALEVLGAMGTDLALSLVGRVSRSAQKQYLKDRAVEILSEIAEARGLTADELEDRTAPDLGLDAEGTMVLDFGPRSFRVGFDEHLMPFVKDEAGTRLDTLPRVNKADDANKAKAAWEAWKALRIEAEKVSKDQIARLQRMMADERRIEAEVFLDAFVKHPLVGHVAQRLVWGVFVRGALKHTFRVSEDRSLATIDDAPFTLAPDAQVGLVHPLHLGDDTPKWGTVLSDYAIVQPFGQLSRPTFADPKELALAAVLARYADAKAPTSPLFTLRASGWRSSVGEYADIEGFTREVGDTTFYLRLQPAMVQGAASTLHTLHLTASSRGETAPTPVQLSELIFGLDAILAR